MTSATVRMLRGACRLSDARRARCAAAPRRADDAPRDAPSRGAVGGSHGSGALAGLIAGTVMSMAMMLAAVLRGESVWAVPNMIAAMWLGPGAASGAATGAAGLPTRVGMATHEATSAAMGVSPCPSWPASTRGSC